MKAGSRSTINEAFRVMRTNVEFMCKEGDCHILMFTSYNPGSGKSFITMNFAMSLAIKNKRVLVIDGDMRHGSMSQFVNGPKVGMSNYLAGKIEDVRTTLGPINEKHPNLKVLPVGIIPPNPTELLSRKRFDELIDELRKRRRQQKLTDELTLQPEQLSYTDPVEPHREVEARVDLTRALATLPVGLRQVVELGVYQDLPYAEIAEILGIPVGTVKSRMFNALAKLKACLTGDKGGTK